MGDAILDGCHDGIQQRLVDIVIPEQQGNGTGAFGLAIQLSFIYIFSYLMVVVLFAAVNITGGLDFTTGVTASIACIGNVGPGFGEVGSISNYAGLSNFLKLTSMAEMLIGRLEIFPILYLIRSVRLR